MEKEQLLQLLSKKDQSVEKSTDQNPYNQSDLHKHISDSGFAVEQKPNLSELAKLLSKNIDTKPELEAQVEKNPLTLVREKLLSKSEKEPQSESPDKQLSVKALKQLIAKLKGE